ncbi:MULTISPECIES: TonB-dependent receptor [Hyphomonas]|uniref:TonB-dependent receptor n=1 Tax=Hyphomonas TaxID=85 RepID=UPI002353CF77|nr:TonB-dependent receptor [Hyphomonas atlantica]
MTKIKRHMAVLMSSAAIGTLMAAPTAAQDNTESTDRVLNTVTVTAQKREQSVTDVGIAISVVGEQEIRARRVETASDLVVFTPNATVKENIPGLMPVVTIRGVGLNDFNATNNPATGVYVDEISLSSLALLSSDLFDLERMEVLKGPQGTLYGRNSTAGALNIVSAKPTFDGVSGRLQAGLSNYDGRELEAVANLPLTDALALRIAGKAIMQDEGFYFDETRDRDVGRRDVLAGRAQVLWSPTGTLNVLLKVEGQQGRSELGSPEFFGALPTATETACPGATGCSDFFGYTDTDGDPYRGAWSVDPEYNYDQFGATARIEADLGPVTLTSVSGYINFSRDFASDTDAGPLRLTDFNNNDDVTQISQEVRLSGTNDLLDWQVGAFYSQDDVKTIYSGEMQELFNTTTLSLADQTSTSTALFGNAEWSLTDTISLVTGLRYSDETREAQNFTQDNVSEPGGSFLTLAPYGTPPIVLASVDDEINDTSWSWKVGVNWKPTSSTLIYASASQGTKSGGFFAGTATSSAQLIPYEPETLVSYEVGIKGNLGSNGIGYDASTFFYDYSDVQTFIRDTVGSIPVQRLGNVDHAELYGADLNVTYQPAMFDGLSLNVGAGLLSSEMGAFEATAGRIPEGNQMPDAPELTLNLGTAYTADLTDQLSLRFSIDGRYQSETFRDALNDPLLHSDGYWVTNARVSLYDEGNWELSVWGKNIADEEYVTQGVNQLGFGYGFRVYGAPQTYGVSVTKHF